MITACPRPCAWRSYALGLGLLPLAAQADFLADSSAHLDLRSFYQLRDYRQHDAPQSQAGNWSQGFVLRLQSGFTGGPLGFGLDATGLLGVKLDSGRGRSNDGTLPFGANSKEPVDDYSHLGLTAKLRYSQTQLQVGILMPQLPVAFRDDVRLLPQTFDGALLTSSEIEGLTLTAGAIVEVAHSRVGRQRRHVHHGPRQGPRQRRVQSRRRDLRLHPSAQRQLLLQPAQGHLPAALSRPAAHPAAGRRAVAAQRPALLRQRRRRRGDLRAGGQSQPQRHAHPCAPAPTPSASVSRR